MTTVSFMGTHEPSWLRTAGVPLFISHRRLMRLKRTLPVAIAPWALDSGGFSELSLYGGWKTTPSDYVDATIRYDREIGKLQFAAPQDLMCEAEMLQRTGVGQAVRNAKRSDLAQRQDCLRARGRGRRWRRRRSGGGLPDDEHAEVLGRFDHGLRGHPMH